MFGLDFTTWMALIGGYPTILTTAGTVLLVIIAGTRVIWRYQDIKNAKYHIKKTLELENEIKNILKNTKPLTRFLFKKHVGEKRYIELTIANMAICETKTEKEIKKEVKRLKKQLKRINRGAKIAQYLTQQKEVKNEK